MTASWQKTNRNPPLETHPHDTATTQRPLHKQPKQHRDLTQERHCKTGLCKGTCHTKNVRAKKKKRSCRTSNVQRPRERRKGGGWADLLVLEHAVKEGIHVQAKGLVVARMPCHSAFAPAPASDHRGALGARATQDAFAAKEARAPAQEKKKSLRARVVSSAPAYRAATATSWQA